MRKRIIAIICLALLLTAVACSQPVPTNIDTSSMTTEELQATIEALQKENVKLKKENETLTAKDDNSSTSIEESTPELSMEEQIYKSINFENAEIKGMCGSDMYFLYKDGILLLKGTGEMDDGPFVPSIAEVADQIYMIVVEEGCTYIGMSDEEITKWDYLDFPGLRKVIVPDSVKKISYRIFYNSKVTEIEVPKDTIFVKYSTSDEGYKTLYTIDGFPQLDENGDCIEKISHRYIDDVIIKRRK